MSKRLSEWAREQNIKYKKAWQMAEAGTLPVKIEKSSTGRFFVVDETKSADDKKSIVLGMPLMSNQVNALGSKKIAMASGRRNAAATNERTDPYFHIESGVEPFQELNNSISVREAIRLCQKTYWNFSIFRNVIDVMTEFSANPIFFRGGNKKANRFFEELFKKVNILDIQDKFFREYYRSGNVFIYRFDSVLDELSIRKLSKAYNTAVASSVSLPAKYVILNPCDIIVAGNISFSTSRFFKQLNPYEVERLRNPQTDEEKNFYDSLPDATKQILKEKGSGLIINVPLEESNTYSIFYKKQDYEPMAIPMGYPVLKDINWKAEMKSIDMAISRTVQQAVLLINMGYESKNGDYMFDPRIAMATQELFNNESVGKVLVTDFATKVQFVIPQIGELLDPKKYEIVNEDIRVGLNHILTGKNEKFANQYIQVNLFIQRLQQSREVFLNGFLIPEIKRIAKQMNFKNYPEPYFEDLDLKDEIEWTRIMTRLAEIGLLSPWETFEGIETGRIPTKDESIEAQEEYKTYKDKGLYQPIAGGPADQMNVLKETNKNALKIQENQQIHDDKQNTKQRKHEAENPPPAPAPAIHISAPMKQESGRPSGTTKKQTVKRKTKPAGASFSLKEIKDKLWLANDVIESVKSTLKDKFKINELTPEQSDVAREIGESIIVNEDSSKWMESVASYIDNPETKNQERLDKVDEIAYEHQVSSLLASILLESGDA